MTFATFPDLAGRSVFITGGGSGIGAALTDGFLAQGAKVAFIQRSDATQFLDEMEKKHGSRPWFRPCDVTDLDDLKAAIAEAAEANGTISVLVNNAATDQRHDTMEVDAAYWEKMMQVNLRPFLFTLQAVVPGMRERGGGSVINFSSISYMMGDPNMPLYTTAKSAINGMTRGHAQEFGCDGIRVNTVTPGMILTDRQIAEVVSEKDIERHLQMQALKQRLKPDVLVEPVLFLASDASRAITGQALVVDGGVVTTG